MRKIKETFHLSRKKIVIVGVVLCIAVGGSSVAIVYKVTAGNTKTEANVQQTTVNAKQGNLTIGLSGTGTTYVGNSNQLLELSYGSSNETIEVTEVIAKSGATMKKGDAVIKVSTEDVKNLITYYEGQITTATNTLKTAKLTYQSDLAQAKYDYETNLKLKDTSLLEYEASIEELQNTVDAAKEAITNADTKINDYTKALKDNTYYTKYNVAELKTAAKTYETALSKAESAFNKVNKSYENNKKSYESSIKKLEGQQKTAEGKMKKTETEYTKKLEGLLDKVGTTNQPNYTVEGNVLSGLKDSYTAMKKAVEEKEVIDKELSSVKKKLDDLNKEHQSTQSAKQQATEKSQSATKKYQDAVGNYEKAKEQATTNLKSLNNNYSTLEANYKSALLNQEKEIISLNKEYKISTLTYENAKSIYDAATKDLDADVIKAQESLKSLNENLKVLKDISKDGVIKASQAGTIASVAYNTGDVMTAGGTIVSYTKPEIIDVDITVSQSDIASVHVGDKANVSISGQRGQLEGTVSCVGTEPTTSGSVSNVTYTVTVSLDNSEGTLSTDTEASVSIEKETLENVIYVPVNAVKTVGGKSTVKVQKDNGTTENVTVTTGSGNGTYIEIKEGLNVGDICVVEHRSGGLENEDKK